MNPAEYQVMRAEEESHWWYHGLRSMLKRFFTALPMPERMVILDVGCGTGANLRLLKELAPDSLLMGLDRAPEALEGGSSHENLLLCRGDANSLPLADASVDVIVATDLLGQSGVSCPLVLGHFLRVLKPGGVLFLNVPAFSWLRGEHDLAVHVTKRFMRIELRQDLDRAGFSDIVVRFWNGLLLLPMALYRWFSRAVGTQKKSLHSDLGRTGGLVNRVLVRWMEWELRFASSPGLPWGSSLFASARKPLPARIDAHG